MKKGDLIKKIKAEVPVVVESETYTEREREAIRMGMEVPCERCLKFCDKTYNYVRNKILDIIKES